MTEIDVNQLEALGDDVQLIDVREPDEYEAGHVPGAVLIPLGDVPARVDEVPTEGDVYLICRSGARSARAQAWLEAQGIPSTNVAGGTMAWLEAGKPVVTGHAPR